MLEKPCADEALGVVMHSSMQKMDAVIDMATFPNIGRAKVIMEISPKKPHTADCNGSECYFSQVESCCDKAGEARLVRRPFLKR
jgi:hypothetical protein